MVSAAFGKLGGGTLGLACGPEPMTRLARKNYVELGVSEKDVFVF